MRAQRAGAEPGFMAAVLRCARDTSVPTPIQKQKGRLAPAFSLIA
jgi:hypothetical protein